MSLLTKEQKLTTDHIRAKLREDEGWGGRGGYESELLAIIDDLQARVPKQYTEQELTEILQKDYHQYWQGLNGDYFQKGFHEAAQRFGALKAEP